jgi:hypothetical protein
MKIIYFLLFALFLMGCNVPQKHFKNGNYDRAIETAVVKIRKKPAAANKFGDIVLRSYNIQRNRIMDRTRLLASQNNPNAHLEAYKLFVQLDYLQKEIATILPMKIHGKQADFEFIDVMADMVYFKNKAASGLYNEALDLINTGSKPNARNAYFKLREIRTLFPDYQEVQELLPVAKEMGQNHVLVSALNQTAFILPRNFMLNLTYYNPDELNSLWTKFYTQETERDGFDYFVDILIQAVDIGPEQLYEVRTQETKEIQDGFKYALDRRGNVVKDSLGNDVKIPNMIRVHADVVGVEQTKAGFVAGVVTFSHPNGRIIGTFPFREELLFKNYFSTFTGDRRALSKETSESLGGNFISFPTDLQMVMDASEVIKRRSHNHIRRNAKILEN